MNENSRDARLTRFIRQLNKLSKETGVYIAHDSFKGIILQDRREGARELVASDLDYDAHYRSYRYWREIPKKECIS